MSHKDRKVVVVGTCGHVSRNAKVMLSIALLEYAMKNSIVDMNELQFVSRMAPELEVDCCIESIPIKHNQNSWKSTQKRHHMQAKQKFSKGFR